MKTYTVIFFIWTIGTDPEQTGRYVARDIKTGIDPTSTQGWRRFKALANRAAFGMVDGKEYYNILRVKDVETGLLVFDAAGEK